MRNDPAARCAERGPHRELLAAAFATQQYQIGHIGARNQQHESDRHHQRDDERLHVADDRCRERKHDGHQPAGIPRRRRPLELGGHRRELASRLFERNAGSKSPDEIDLAARGIAKRASRRRRMGRAPQLDTARKVQVRHDANDRERLLPDLDATPQHQRRRAVAALPEPAADDRDGLRAVDIVFSAQGAAEHRLDAEHLEEAPGDEGAAHVARVPVLDEQPAAGTVGIQARNRLEQPAVAPHGVDLAIAEWMMRKAGRRQIFPREDEAILGPHR